MVQANLPTDNIKINAERAYNQASPWIERLARFGHIAKGLVYLIIGLLALLAAFDIVGGRTTDSQGAFRTILAQPFGKVLLGGVAVGLAGFALWLFVQAIKDPNNEGADIIGLVKRVGHGIGGLGHLGLAVIAGQLIVGLDSSQNNSPKDWTATVMAHPFGSSLVALVGAIIIGVGLYHLYDAYQAGFRNALKLDEINKRAKMWITSLGRLGWAARGLVFSLIGIFLIRAALLFDPDQAEGLGGALQSLEQQPFGPWLLALVAVGFVAQGIYMFVEARYRRIEPQ